MGVGTPPQVAVTGYDRPAVETWPLVWLITVLLTMSEPLPAGLQSKMFCTVAVIPSPVMVTGAGSAVVQVGTSPCVGQRTGEGGSGGIVPSVIVQTVLSASGFSVCEPFSCSGMAVTTAGLMPD